MKPFLYEKIWSSIPYPAFLIDHNYNIISANNSAEIYFSTSLRKMRMLKLPSYIGKNSLIIDALSQFQKEIRTKTLYDLDVFWSNKKVIKCDLFISKIDNEEEKVLLLFHPKSETNFTENFNIKSAARSLSGISSMFSHEIRNPLAGISGATELLSSNIKGKDIELINVIKYDIERIKNLIDRVETLGEYELFEIEELNIHDILENSKKSALVSFASKIKIITDYDPSLPNIKGDKNQLFQVTQNLLKNASEAIDQDKGMIKISTSYIQGSKLFNNSIVKENLSLKITISDNGKGVQESIKNDIFDPFVSSKKKGSGLGLSIVSKIIETHGGIIKFDRENGWTNFSFFLPVINIKKKFRRLK